MSKQEEEEIFAEMDRILDIATAEENARLLRGGSGVGDLAASAHGHVAHEDGDYFFEEAGEPEEVEVTRERLDPPLVRVAPDRAAMTPKPGAQVSHAEEVAAIERRVNGYGAQERRDIGYLLTVLRAKDRGEL